PGHDLAAVLLRQAPADRDLHAGMSLLDRPQVAEVAVQPVVRVLPHRAGVEHHHVWCRTLHGADVPRPLEQPGQPLGVVDVHLAPVGADLVRARAHLGPEGTCRPCEYPSARPCEQPSARRGSVRRRGSRRPWVPAPLGTGAPGYRRPWVPAPLGTGAPGYRRPWVPAPLGTGAPGYLTAPRYVTARGASGRRAATT